MLASNALGANIPADGFSLPYRILVAFGPAVYGFCGLLFSYFLDRKYLDSSRALLATVAVCAGSSLPDYMYFNPFWSHADSAFIVALWYWDRTRGGRTWGQWLLLGVISGLMVDVYVVNDVFLLIPPIECIAGYARQIQSHNRAAILSQLGQNVLYFATVGVTILLILITRKLVFGGLLRLGAYSVLPWNWHAPFWSSVLVSADHRLLSWTPLLGLVLLGLFLPYAQVKPIQG